MPFYIKARKHHGSKSLDLTIPAEIARNQGIHVGDMFIVEFEKKNDEFKLIYKRIYNNS